MANKRQRKGKTPKKRGRPKNAQIKQVVKKKMIPAPPRNANKQDNMDRGERPYKFDERLVPYFTGGDSKTSNIAIREALIKLGKTPEMTELFAALRVGNLDYREDGKDVLVKVLLAIINGHDKVSLTSIFEEDIQAIHDHNLKQFNEFWEELDKKRDNNGGNTNGLN